MLFWTALPNWSWYITAVTTNTRPQLWRIFPLCWKLVFVDVNQLFPWFSHALMQTEKVLSSLNDGKRLTRIISNDDGVFTTSSRWRITLLKQRGLCELIEIAETRLYSLRECFQVVYLIVWKHGSRGRIAKEQKLKSKRKISHGQAKNVSSMKFKWIWNLQIYLISFFMLSNKIQN